MNNNKDNHQNIVIVGGGSAGWLLASRLASHFSLAANNSASITVIESPDIASIGVGEGTWPTMRKTLRRIGVKESDFMRACGASFKQGTKFINWLYDSKPHQYYHPFEAPRGHDYCNTGQRWIDFSHPSETTFDLSVSPQPSACEKLLAPKTIATAEYQAVLNYGYHFDAVKMAAFLREHAVTNLGVRLITDNVTQVVKDDSGWITSLQTETQGNVEGSFYFDCTGFKSLLLNQSLAVPYRDLKDYLFVDRALALQVPNGYDQSPIESTTHSTAHAAGWIWDIPLCDRRGVGAVYSSAHMSDDEALSVLHKYVGDQASNLTERKIQFESRHLQRFWEKNAVAVGLSAGFVEPLEASALVLIEISADWFCHRFPSNRAEATMQSKQYNRTFRGYWDQIIDFLKFHYTLSQRTSPFWQDNRNPESMTENLKECMQLWQQCAPCEHDFIDSTYVFSWESFQYVYFGMQYGSQTPSIPMSNSQEDLARRDFTLNEQITKKALSSLPTNRNLLNKVKEHNFTNI